MRMTDRTETEEAKAGSIYLRMVAGVHPAGMSETCEALFETLGYGPLRVFFEAAGGEDLCGNQPVSRVRAARNRHRHAIEQASRRWRGGRRERAVKF